MHLTNNQDSVIYLRLTVPFGCAITESRCHIDLNVFFPKKRTCELINPALKGQKNSCGIRFYNNENDTLKPLTLQNIYTKNLQAQGRHLTVRLATKPRINYHKIFQGYLIEPIQVSFFLLAVVVYITSIYMTVYSIRGQVCSRYIVAVYPNVYSTFSTLTLSPLWLVIWTPPSLNLDMSVVVKWSVIIKFKTIWLDLCKKGSL